VLAAFSASMNSNLWLTEARWRSTRQLFQEDDLLLKFPELTLSLPKPYALAHRERRLVAGVLTPVGIYPVRESTLDDTKFLGDLRDRTRRLDHQFHGVFPELGRVIVLAPWQ
jgi:hypothetical protein